MTLLSFTRRWNNDEIAELIRENTCCYTKDNDNGNDNGINNGNTDITLRCHRTTTTMATNKGKNVNNKKRMKKKNSIVTGLAFYEIQFDQQISLALKDFFRSLLTVDDGIIDETADSTHEDV
jgi:hypothetical protein